MRDPRLLFALVAALAVSACARHQPTYYVVDPQTGQPVPVVAQQPQFAQPQYPQQPDYAQAQAAQQFYAQQPYPQPSYGQPSYPPSAPAKPAARSSGRGFFTRQPSASAYAQQPNYAQQGGPYVAAPNAYAAAPSGNLPYTLDSGDRLRIVVFGQDGITNSYTVDAGGNITMPLVGSVTARGFTTAQLAQTIGERLKQGYVREPHVTVEVETYRPFFILGEVTNPGQYPYVANMTAETAIAIAGGFGPRANKSKVEITRNAPGQ